MSQHDESLGLHRSVPARSTPDPQRQPDDRKQLNAPVGLMRPFDDETTAANIARVPADVASLPVGADEMRDVESDRLAVPELRRRD